MLKIIILTFPSYFYEQNRQIQFQSILNCLSVFQIQSKMKETKLHRNLLQILDMILGDQLYNQEQNFRALILKIMDKNYTPQKQPKTTVRQTAQSYSRNTPEPGPRIAPATQLAILKDYESLKIQVRQLETKNRSLTNQIQQLLYEKTYNQNKYIQKMNFEEEAITQFHKEKNYQLELLQIKHEEEISKLKREAELRVDEFLREIKHKDYQLKEKDEQNRYLEMRNEELRRDYETLNIEFAKCRQQNSIASQKLTHNDFTIKKLQMHLEELELVKSQMESQIRTLLDIEAEKSISLNNLEIQLRTSEDNQRRLVQKLTILGQNFAQLEDHISVMKQKLLHADESNHLLTQKLNSAEIDNHEKERQILEQNERESHLRLELEEHQKRQSRREREVNELMAENQRLYKQLNINRHRLHEFGIAYGVDI